MATDDLKAFAARRAGILSASSAWGHDNDAALLNQLLARISELEAQLAARDAAGLALYDAGKWELHDSNILPHEQAVMWERLRDAMGLQPGHSTAITSGDYAKGQTDAQQGD